MKKILLIICTFLAGQSLLATCPLAFFAALAGTQTASFLFTLAGSPSDLISSFKHPDRFISRNLVPARGRASDETIEIAYEAKELMGIKKPVTVKSFFSNQRPCILGTTYSLPIYSHISINEKECCDTSSTSIPRRSLVQIIYHEMGHALHNHILFNNVENCRKRELEAETAAALYMAKSGKYTQEIKNSLREYIGYFKRGWIKVDRDTTCEGKDWRVRGEIYPTTSMNIKLLYEALQSINEHSEFESDADIKAAIKHAASNNNQN
jgi:hypothetical protein